MNTLANNLTNSRYFNYTLVDTIKPDPIEKPLELPPDLQELVDQQKIEEQQVASLQKADAKSGQEVTQNVADETQFAGTQPTDQQSEKSQAEQQKMQQRASENDQLQAQAREEKKVPGIVTVKIVMTSALM